MSLIDAIGLFGTVLGIIGFVQNQIPDSSPKGAVFRVKVGHQENAGQNYVSALSAKMRCANFLCHAGRSDQAHYWI